MGTKSHPKNALAAIFVAKTRKPGRYADGNGLYLIIEPSGSRRWEQRILIRGKRRTLGLGGYPLVSLAAAREKALENRRLARAGYDPLATRHAVTRVPTFADAMARVFELRKPGWRSARHAAQWISSLNEYAMPRLGARSVTEIDAAEIVDVLSPLWHTMPVTAQRLRQRIGVVLKWAIAQGYRRDNPADAVPIRARTAILPTRTPSLDSLQRGCRCYFHSAGVNRVESCTLGARIHGPDCSSVRRCHRRHMAGNRPDRLHMDRSGRSHQGGSRTPRSAFQSSGRDPDRSTDTWRRLRRCFPWPEDRPGDVSGSVLPTPEAA